MPKDEEIQCLLSGEFSSLGRNNQWCELHVVGSNVAETTSTDEEWAAQWSGWAQWWPKSSWCWQSAGITSVVLSNHHDAGVPDHNLVFWTFCGVTETHKVGKLALSN